MSQDNYRLSLKVGASGPVFLGLGVLGTAGCVFSFLQNRKEFFASYLTAFVFFMALSLGALFFVIVNHLARSSWSVTVRRIAETSAANLPWMGLLFLPLLAGLGDLFIWTHPEVMAAEPLLQKKAAYLNLPFFLIRNACYFLVWIGLSRFFFSTSVKQDSSGEPALSTRMGKVAALGAILFALSQTFFAFDWIMTLDPHWFSTMFGVYYFAGAVVAQYCFLIIVTSFVRRVTGRKDIYNLEHFHDMGKLLFGHNVFWTYIGFSQFFLIWYANIPEETIFFLHRSEGGWKTVSLMLPWCHFLVPFLYFMSWHVKRNVVAITLGCFWLLIMCYIDIYWLIQPNFHHHGPHFGISDVSSLMAVGGFFMFLFLNRIKRVNLIPAGDPRLQESLHYDNGIIAHERH